MSSGISVHNSCCGISGEQSPTVPYVICLQCRNVRCDKCCTQCCTLSGAPVLNSSVPNTPTRTPTVLAPGPAQSPSMTVGGDSSVPISYPERYAQGTLPVTLSSQCCACGSPADQSWSCSRSRCDHNMCSGCIRDAEDRGVPSGLCLCHVVLATFGQIKYVNEDLAVSVSEYDGQEPLPVASASVCEPCGVNVPVPPLGNDSHLEDLLFF